MAEIERTGKEQKISEGGVEQRQKNRSDPPQKDVQNFQNAMKRGFFAFNSIVAPLRQKTEKQKKDKDAPAVDAGEELSTRPVEKTYGHEEDGLSMENLLPEAAFVLPIQLPVPKVENSSPPSVKSLDEVIHRLVSQILVHETTLSQGKEVRLDLKDPLLGGSQVQILRDGDSLRVIFLTKNSQQADLISQQQGLLRSALVERMTLNNVEIRSRVRGGENNLSGGGGDGRSRGQRDSREEYERNEELRNPFASKGRA
ncbi:MAG: hypothetical protein LBH53_01915 [Puniceicoccales bacterium]|jgi:type III secretion system needle length determinant|nr:hypothetical protein [Puniceicoccales bacterium]